MASKQPYVSKKKGSKKGLKKKPADNFAKKEVYNLKAPVPFINRMCGRTLVTKITAKQNVEKLLVGRCFTVNQADLNPEDPCYRKYNFVISEVRGREALGAFNGMELVTDKAKGIVRKWHKLIEGELSATTTDNFLLRVFVVAQTKKLEGDTKPRCYIQTSKVKEIRKIMFEIINEEVTDCNMESFILKLCSEKIGKEIEKRGSMVFPLQNCFVKKVMVVKKPAYVKVEDELEEDNQENIDQIDFQDGGDNAWEPKNEDYENTWAPVTEEGDDNTWATEQTS